MEVNCLSADREVMVRKRINRKDLRINFYLLFSVQELTHKLVMLISFYKRESISSRFQKFKTVF